MKKILLTLLLTTLGFSLFAINSYEGGTDEGRYAKSSPANSSVKVEFELGTIFGYDIQEGQSGFKEIIDLDFTYILNPFTIYKSDTTDIKYGDPYGIVDVSGCSVELNINDESGDKNSYSDTLISINYELIYGKIVFDPFYLLVAASSAGNHYDRNNGWNFSRGTSRIRANIAHIGYNVPWTGIVSVAPWSISGAADAIDNEGAESMLGIGYIVGMTEMMVQVGSQYDWETNENNELDFGYQIESNPIGNLTLKGQLFTGINYDVLPLNFSVGAGYYQDITSNLNLTPFIGYDGTFVEGEDPSLDNLKSETSVGISLGWPGSVGWGYEPLNDKDYDRFSGVTIGTSVLTLPEEDPRISIGLSLFEDGKAGLIPNIGSSIVFEIYDLTDYMATDRGYIKTSYGVYLDYNINDILKPYTRVKKLEGKDDSPVKLEAGFEYTAIPNTVITVSYETENVVDISNNKGLFITEFKVVL
ncbi:MAG: hypothetical protein JXR64_06905 [Spirochaetales bacterium]|nr:hypothetical protein [Spirochaetales bacterium]